MARRIVRDTWFQNNIFALYPMYLHTFNMHFLTFVSSLTSKSFLTSGCKTSPTWKQNYWRDVRPELMQKVHCFSMIFLFFVQYTYVVLTCILLYLRSSLCLCSALHLLAKHFVLVSPKRTDLYNMLLNTSTIAVSSCLGFLDYM